MLQAVIRITQCEDGGVQGESQWSKELHGCDCPNYGYVIGIWRRLPAVICRQKNPGAAVKQPGGVASDPGVKEVRDMFRLTWAQPQHLVVSARVRHMKPDGNRRLVCPLPLCGHGAHTSPGSPRYPLLNGANGVNRKFFSGD